MGQVSGRDEQFEGTDRITMNVSETRDGQALSPAPVAGKDDDEDDE